MFEGAIDSCKEINIKRNDETDSGNKLYLKDEHASTVDGIKRKSIAR